MAAPLAGFTTWTTGAAVGSVFAADGVIIPISTDYLAMKGAVQMERTLKALEQVLKRRVPRRSDRVLG